MADEQQTNPTPTGDTNPPIPGIQQQGADEFQDWTKQPTQQTAPPDEDDEGPPQSPQQSPDQTAQQFPFPGDQTSQTPSPGQQLASSVEKAADNSKFMTPDLNQAPPQVQQAVQSGGYAHSIIQALAGGPRIKTTIDPQTGTVTHTRAPLTNGQAGMAIALSVLTGAFNGLAQKGPGAEGRAAAAGFNGAVQQKQQQLDQDNDEAAKTYARQAALAQTNFMQHETAQRMGYLDYDFHQKVVAQNQPSIAALDKVGAIQARGVKEGDLLKQYNVTKDTAVVDGTVARVDANGNQVKDKYGQPVWDNTYTVIDPSKKIALSPEMAQNLAAHHVPGYFTMQDGKAVPKDFQGSAQVRAGLYLNGVAQANAIDTTEGQLNQQLGRLTTQGPDTAKQFDANLTKALDSQSVSPKDLTTFAKYASMPFDEALTQMRKDKVDPQTIGNIAKLIPQDTQDAMRKQRLDAENKDNAVREATTAHVKAQTALPDQLREEQMKKSIDAKFAYQNAFNSEAGRVQAKNKFGDGGGAVTHEMVNNPKLSTLSIDPNDQPVNGVRKGYLGQLQTVDPALAAEVQAVGEGRLVQSKYGLAKGDGQRLAGIVAQAYPDYDQSKGDSYDKMRTQFTEGTQANLNTAGRTTLQHLARLYDTAGSPLAGVPLTKTKSDFISDSGRAIDEMNSAYTKGVLHKDDRERLENNADSVLPSQRQEFAKESMRLLADKIGQTQTAWQYGKPSKAVADFPLLDQDSVDAYNHVLHGESAIDEFGHVAHVAGTMKDQGGNAWYVDKNKRPLYQVQTSVNNQ